MFLSTWHSLVIWVGGCVNSGVPLSVKSDTLEKKIIPYLTQSWLTGLLGIVTAVYWSLLPALTQGTACFSLTTVSDSHPSLYCLRLILYSLTVIVASVAFCRNAFGCLFVCMCLCMHVSVYCEQSLCGLLFRVSESDIGLLRWRMQYSIKMASKIVSGSCGLLILWLSEGKHVHSHLHSSLSNNGSTIFVCYMIYRAHTGKRPSTF